jgi:predicted nucleotidyltransferase
MILTDEIIKIKDIIVKTIPLEKLYLFGSYAYGMPDTDSDYDFYAVIPDGSMRPLDAMYEVGMATGRMKRRPMDFIVGTREIFERRSNQAATLEHEIANKGVVIYESGE